MVTIREMRPDDGAAVIGMMREFYTSPAVITDGSEKIFAANIANCLSSSTCAEGFVFVDGEKIIGYGITARSYSTEFGGECVWIEDIYIAAEYRGRGVGSQFIRYVAARNPDKILRLETEADNTKAVTLYKRLGFKELPYLEMVRCGD